jgi:uncharacterized lipoprotein YmbA
MRSLSGRLIVLALVWFWFAACVHVGQQPEQPWPLLTLSPLPEPAARHAGTPSSSGPVQSAIGVGPIHLPGYLDQDQLVTRISENRVSLSDGDRWAEPLEDNIAETLAHNLSILLRTGRVILHPWPAQQRPTYQLEIDVLSFEPDTAGTAHLAARWFLRDVASGQTIAQNEANLTATAVGTSSERPVASLSKALGDFSLRIANMIREIVQPNTTQSALEP